MKELRCHDLGFDCNAVVMAASDEEVLVQVAAHAKAMHGWSEEQVADASLKEQVRTQTREQ